MNISTDDPVSPEKPESSETDRNLEVISSVIGVVLFVALIAIVCVVKFRRQRQRQQIQQNGELAVKYERQPRTPQKSPNRHPEHSPKMPSQPMPIPRSQAGAGAFHKIVKVSTSSSNNSDDYIIPENPQEEEIYENGYKQNHTYLNLRDEPQQPDYMNYQDKSNQRYVNVDNAPDHEEEEDSDPSYDYATFSRGFCSSAMKAQVSSPMAPSSLATSKSPNEGKSYVNVPENQDSASDDKFHVYNNTYLPMNKNKYSAGSLYKMRLPFMKKVILLEDTKKDPEPPYFDMSGRKQ